MGLCSLKVGRMLLLALVVSAITLTSCVDVPVPAVCDYDDFSEVSTLVSLNVDCSGTEPLLEAILDPDDINADNAQVYVEAICIWNQNESSQAEIDGGLITTTQGFMRKVENVPSGANCTFAGCYVANDRGYLLESKLCLYNRDECSLGEDDCHENASCNDTIDGFECHCLPTFTGDGRNCTEILLPTTTTHFLPTATSSLLPTATPGTPLVDTPSPFLSLLVLVLVALMSSVAVLALTIWWHSRRKYRRISSLGKVDPDCMLVNPKTIVHHLSITSLRSELHELNFDTTDNGNQWIDKNPISRSMVEIQQLSFHLEPTSSSSEEGDDNIHYSSLPNTEDGLKMAGTVPRNDTLELPGTQTAPELHFDPTTAEAVTEQSSSLLADNTVDWCLEDVMSINSDSNLQSSATEYCTSLGPTHQSDSQTQYLYIQTHGHSAPSDHQSIAAVMDGASLTDSTQLGTPVTDTVAETSLVNSVTSCEQPDDKLDEGEEEREQQDGFLRDTPPSASGFSRLDGGLNLEEGHYVEQEEGDYIITVDLPGVSYDRGEYIDTQGIGVPCSDVRQQHQGVTLERMTPSWPMVSHGGDLGESQECGHLLEIDLTQQSQSVQHQMATY